jgi:hypothetical protein
VMAFVAAARAYSMAVDGIPNLPGRLYLGVEATLAIIFLSWPPPIIGSSAHRERLTGGDLISVSDQSPIGSKSLPSSNVDGAMVRNSR